jgi:DNA-directed RNA polymerase specialized sigma54-like protein
MDDGRNKRQTVEQRIELTQRQIARQMEIIQALQSQGYPTDGAERVLDGLRHVLQLREAELRRLQT